MTYENNHQTDKNTTEETPKEIRADIEQTREEMSRTLEAIAEKVNPQNVKASAQKALSERVQGVAHQAQEKLAPVVGIAQNLFQQAETKVQQMTDKGTVPEGDGTPEGGSLAKVGKNLKPIGEQVVVVFGASSGIGRETVLEFARQGAKVVAAARSESALISLREDLEHLKANALICIADAADFAQVQGVAEKNRRKVRAHRHLGSLRGRFALCDL